MASLPAVDAADVSSVYAKAASIIDAAAKGEDVDMSEARVLLQNAAAAGYPAAVGRLGRWHLFGLYGVARNLRQALVLLHAAASAGDTESCYWLGHALSKMDEFVQQERVLQAALQASASSSSSSSQVLSVPPVANPDPTRDESEVEAAARVSAAQEVILALRAMRKANAAAKAHVKKQGAAAPTPAPAGQEGKPTGLSPAGGAFDPVTLPLKSHPALAYSWLVLAAQGEHADAMVSLGNLCMAWEGQGAGPERTKEAVQWYELAARLPGKEESATPTSGGAGHPDAQYNLGMSYWDGVPGAVDRDRERALLAFTTAAEQGDASARMFLGHAYRTGPPGVRVNRGKALMYLELATADGHGGAAHYLAQLWRDGDASIGLKADLHKALYFLGLACDADVPEAWAERGDVLLHGGWSQERQGGEEGVEQAGKPTILQAPGLTVDLPGALYAYERAGSLGHAAALVSAGAMHYQGLGAPANAQLSGERYRAAGEMGSPQGWDNLAALHAKGEGVPQSLQAARTYRDLAARIRKMGGGGQGGESAAAGRSDCEGSLQYSPAAQGEGGGCGKATCGCK